MKFETQDYRGWLHTAGRHDTYLAALRALEIYHNKQKVKYHGSTDRVYICTVGKNFILLFKENVK